MGLLIKKKKKVRQCKKRYGAIPVPVFYRTLTGLDHNNNNRKKKNENYTYDKLWIRSLISEKKNRFEIKKCYINSIWILVYPPSICFLITNRYSDRSVELVTNV